MLSCTFNEINGCEHKDIANSECKDYIFQRVSAISNSPSGTLYFQLAIGTTTSAISNSPSAASN